MHWIYCMHQSSDKMGADQGFWGDVKWCRHGKWSGIWLLGEVNPAMWGLAQFSWLQLHPSSCSELWDPQPLSWMIYPLVGLACKTALSCCFQLLQHNPLPCSHGPALGSCSRFFMQMITSFTPLIRGSPARFLESNHLLFRANNAFCKQVIYPGHWTVEIKFYGTAFKKKIQGKSCTWSRL